jgi:hypothetical protein
MFGHVPLPIEEKYSCLTGFKRREALSQGRKYYVTVQACNRADVCRVTSSDSVIFDNSPPTPGRVTVGMYSRHDKFLGHK